MSRQILNSRLLRPLWLTGFVVVLGLNAQDDNNTERGVARISLLQGDVSVRRGDSGEWVAAAPNTPLVVQDRLITGGGASIAEVQLDYSNLVRLAAGAEVRFAELEYGRFLLQLASGTVNYRILRDSDAQVELSTPNVAIHPLRRGLYRLTILPDDTTEITVRSGRWTS